MITIYQGWTALPTLDGDNNRLSDGTNRFVLDTRTGMSQVLMDMDIGNTPTAYYVFGAGLLAKITPSGNAYVYQHDLSGNVKNVMDSSGVVKNSYNYGPFGKILSKTENINNRYTFVGKFGVSDDGTGLYYMRNRYYDKDTQQFISRDKAVGNFANPLTLHKYAYGNNNPISFVDPLGLSAKEAIDKAVEVFSDVRTFINMAKIAGKAMKGKNMNFTQFKGIMKGILGWTPDITDVFIAMYDTEYVKKFYATAPNSEDLGKIINASSNEWAGLWEDMKKNAKDPEAWKQGIEGGWEMAKDLAGLVGETFYNAVNTLTFGTLEGSGETPLVCQLDWLIWKNVVRDRYTLK